MANDYITGEKSPVVALILNLCIGFVGYFYIGQWQKALAYLGFIIISFVLSIVTLGITSIITGPIGFIIWIVAVIDVFMQAKIMEEGGSVKHWTFFSSGA